MRKFSLLSSMLFLLSHVSICQKKEKYEIVEYNDISYLASNDTLQRLNLVLPVKKDKIPLLIWIGGGAWSYGNKNQEMDLAKKFALEGIAVASVGHRLSPAIWRDPKLNTGVQHPKHIEDIAASVKWLYENAAEYGYDLESFFIGGFSSGGHLAALISLDSSYLNQFGLSPTLFKGIIPISGTYDIADYHKVLLNGGRPELAELHVEAVFGDTERDFIGASPIAYLENLSVPILLISDNNMYNYSRLFEDKIRETEFRNMQVVYSYNLSHGDLWRNLSYSEQSMFRDIILSFIETHLGIG